MLKFIGAVLLISFKVVTAQTNQINGVLQTAEKLYKNSPDSAYILSNREFLAAEKNEDLATQAEASLLLGDIFYSEGLFPRAMEYYLLSKTHYTTRNNKLGIANSLLSLGKVNYYIKQKEEAAEYFNEALLVYRELDAQKYIAETMGEIGHLHEKWNNLDSAMIYQQTALRIYESLNDKTGIAYIYENIGSIHEDLKEYEQAFRYFKKAVEINTQLDNKISLVGNLNNIGDYYRNTGHYDSALYYTNAALALSQELKLKYEESLALRDLGRTYKLIGDLSNTFYYLEESRVIYDKVFSEESNRQMALLQTLYEVERKNNEIKQLESNRQIQQIRVIGITIGSIVLLLLGGVIVNLQRLKIRKNQELFKQQKKLHASEVENIKLREERLKIELEHKHLQEKHLQLELESQYKSLGVKMLQLTEKNKLLEDLKESLKIIGGSIPTTLKPKLKEAVSKIDFNFHHDDTWEEFRRNFEQLHQDFFDRLLALNPSLTANDLKMCALIKMNLESKDIAHQMGISIDSFRVARYRLRKKLGLSQKDNLRNFVLTA